MVIPIAIGVAAFKAFCWFCGTVGTCYCAKKAYDAYRKHHDTEQKKLEYSHEEKMAARERNKQIDTEKKDNQQKIETNEDKIQDLQKKSEEAHKNSKNSNLTEEERIYHRNKSQQYDEEIDKLKKENQEHYNKIKGLDKQKQENDKIINSSNSKNKSWIWEFLTLENILIMLAIYALYNIVRDERKH